MADSSTDSSKVALVTGGAQGIGLAIGKALLKSGAKVGLIDIADEVLTKTCASLKEEGYGPDRVLGVQCDVTDNDQLVKAFHKVKDTFGSQLDIVVNNAGIVNEMEWEKTLQINLSAVIAGTKTAIELMSTRSGGRGGVVINVSSMAGVVGHFGCPVYSASKAGVIFFTKSMQLAKATDGVRVNCICPVFVDTPFLDGARESNFLKSAIQKTGGLVSPEYVAEGVMKLITDESVNGQALRISLSEGHKLQEYNDPMDVITVEEFIALSSS